MTKARKTTSRKPKRTARISTSPARKSSRRPALTQTDAARQPDEFLADTQSALRSAVVAVGASAGGFEAFSQVLENLCKNPDLAFVFIQHLSPQHASSLVELLSPKTSLEVRQATNGMVIEPNTISVIPPNVQVEVVDGRLHLLPRPTDKTQFTPIDFFFQSIARWAQDRAIGIILSGTASDGAAGIREIKALGGITIAQKPETARHDGMPRAAIGTGMVDLVLAPKDIAENLGHVRWHPYMLRAAAESPEAQLTEQQFRDVCSVLRRVSGIDFKQYKMPTVRRRLLRRMALLRLTDPTAYVRYVSEHSGEAKALSQDLLIHVTRFFRDPESFAALGTQVLETLIDERREDPVRIWVPGCATGEEAYSIAICILETLGDRLAERRVQIFATDVSDPAIDQARTGTFPVSISADVSADRLKRFFTKTDGGYRVAKVLRDMCVFARHDLTRDPPFSRLDLVVCRNVLIYLDLPLQKRLISTFHYALKANGFLMLGPAETTGPPGYFTVVDKKWRIFRKLAADIRPALSLPAEPTSGTRLAQPATRRVAHAEGKSVQDEATRLILDRYGPPGVIVDSTQQIVQFRGHTGPYLEAAAGEPNLNVLKMARSGLLHPLRTALHTARRRSRTVRKDRIMVQRNGDWMQISLEVVPLATSRGEHFLVLFTPTGSSDRAGRSGRQKKGSAHPRPARHRDSDSRVLDLRRELAASREYLQSIIQELEAANEELQSANEEILSSNEELQSTNEELDTAKEELQSTNEELNTVNEELHSRNEELTRVNSDLVNLLGSVDIPIVIVGSGLEIRRFTPRAEQLFNLIPGDIGRPIGQINPNIEVPDLEHLIRETIDSVAPREREVLDRTGRWQSLRIRPYKGVDNRLDGAVVAVIDIDAAKRYEAHVARAKPEAGA